MHAPCFETAIFEATISMCAFFTFMNIAGISSPRCRTASYLFGLVFNRFATVDAPTEVTGRIKVSKQRFDVQVLFNCLAISPEGLSVL